MNCQIQEARGDWLSTNERVALHHSVLIVQFQSSEVGPGAELAQVLVLARFAGKLHTAIKKGRGDPTFSRREKVGADEG